MGCWPGRRRYRGCARGGRAEVAPRTTNESSAWGDTGGCCKSRDVDGKHPETPREHAMPTILSDRLYRLTEMSAVACAVRRLSGAW